MHMEVSDKQRPPERCNWKLCDRPRVDKMQRDKISAELVPILLFELGIYFKTAVSSSLKNGTITRGATHQVSH